MLVIRSPSELRDTREVCLALGFFDGVHLGHQRIISQTLIAAAQLRGMALVLTFDAHPSTVVRPDLVPPLLQTPKQRVDTIQRLGVDGVLMLHFDREFSHLPAEVFIRKLVSDFGSIAHVSVGTNFHFGYRRKGNVDVLRELGRELGFTVDGSPPVEWRGEPVSSTRIRQAVQAGEILEASEMLGRPYSFAGEVLRGDGIGRQLGFPTANVNVAGLALPPHGVYVVKVLHGLGQSRGVLNIGRRPTLRQAAPELRAEVHLLDFTGDLYGSTLEVIVQRKLRDERHFPSLDALREQIAADVAASAT